MSHQNRASAHFKQAEKPLMVLGWDPDYPKPARTRQDKPPRQTNTTLVIPDKDKGTTQAWVVAASALGQVLSLSARLVFGVFKVSASCLVFVGSSLSAHAQRQRQLADKRRYWRQLSNEARQDAFVQQSRQSPGQGRIIEVKVTTKVKVHV